MLKEFDRVVLTDDLPDDELEAGDVGVIVFVHRGGEAYEVEFVTLDGNTIAVTTAYASQVRPITADDISHARRRIPA